MKRFLHSLILWLFVLAAVPVLAQKISGKVTDTDGEALIGASVQIKGTTTGTTTDTQGAFTLDNVAKGSTLLISYVGFLPQEVASDGDLNISMKANGTLGEVLVTAENRAVSAQNVPITMDLVAGSAILKQGVSDLLQLQNLAPGLNIVQNTIFNQITVRGVGSHDGAAELSDQAVTIGIDGEYINRPVALNAAMFDLERVEVLKGPQGTLYGRNATAGAVNIIAQKPTNRTEVDLSAGLGNYGAVKLNGVANLPLGKIAAIRAAAMLSKHDGYRDGGDLVGRIDNGNVWATRLGLSINPNKAFSIYLAGEYNKTDQQAPAQYGVNLGNETSVKGQAPANYSTELPKDFDVATAGFMKVDQGTIRARIAYDFGKAKITYTGGYRDVKMDGYQPLNGFVPETFSFDNELGYQTQSHELRINGESKKLIWQAGGFMGDERQDVARGLVLVGAKGAFGGVPPYLNFFIRDIDSKTSAVFAQATYNLSSKLGLTLGLRNTSDKKTRSGADLASAPFAPNAVVFKYPNAPTSTTQNGMKLLPNTLPSEGSWNQTTWMANFDYKLAKDKMIFAKVSTGYKAGGFDNVGNYDPEKLTAIEIGTKNKFADNRLRLNASIFNYDYRDQQVSVFISTAVGGAIQNAGSTKINGLELDGDFLASKSDRFKFTINYLDAEFKDFPTQQNRVGVDNEVVNLKGNVPIQAPKWTLVGGYDHDFKLGSGMLSFGVRSMFKSEYYLTPFNFTMDKQAAYTKTDLNLTYTGKGDKWDVGVFVQNLEDNRILTYSAFSGGTINIYNWIFGTPRTIGLQLNYHLRGKNVN